MDIRSVDDAAAAIDAARQAVAREAERVGIACSWLIQNGHRLEERSEAALSEPFPTFLQHVVVQLARASEDLARVAAQLEMVAGDPARGATLSVRRLQQREGS